MLSAVRSRAWVSVLLLILPFLASGQTNPVPFLLASGNYALNEWSSTTAAGVYPQSMAFHTSPVANPNLAAATGGDYAGVYNSASGPRVTGLGLNGFYLATTLTAAPGIGAASLALDSRGRTNITVGFQSRTFLAGNPSGLRLQYRTASNGTWTDVPGPVEFVSNGSTSGSNTNYSINLSTLTSGLCDNRPTLQLRWKFYSISGTGANSCAILLDEISVSSTSFVGPHISTGVMPLTDYCLTPTDGNAVALSFSYTPIDSFPAGTNFIVQMSDASGSFTSPITTGTLVSDGSGQQSITINQPPNTPAGLNYRFRVRTSTLAGNDNGAPIRIRLTPLPINAITVSARYKAVWLNWTPPDPCWDEVMIVARKGTFSTTAPTGNGSAYTPDSTFGLGTAIGGGFVVYKGTDTTARIFGLIPDTTYGLTVWTRYRSDWTNYSPLSVITPSAPAVENIKRKIIQGEYFWNISDPGPGNGTPFQATDGNLDQAFENLFKNSITVPNNGRSLFNVRVKDNAGLWSPVFSTIISVDSTDSHPGFPTRRITYAEWFWNSDPGQGNGNPMLVFDGAFNQAFEQLAASGLQVPGVGRSLFNIRVKDRDNQWSPVFTTSIHVDSIDTHPGFDLRKVTFAEWFWNSDPGVGNATPMLVFDGAFNQAFEQLYANGLVVPNKGRSTFSVRVKDRDNTWGPVFTTVVHVDSVDSHPGFFLRRVSQAEWFWNADPGVGNANPMLALDGALDRAFEDLFANGLNVAGFGRSTFNIRVKDRDGVWSSVFTTIIHKDSIDYSNGNPLRKIIQAEYWWNNDPGPGNGQPLLATDGNLNQAFENLIANGLQVPKKGRSTFNVRVKDRDNAWSATFTTIVHADSIDVLSNLFRPQRVKAAEYFWNFDPGAGNGTPLQPSDQYANSAFESFSNLFPQTLPNGIHLLGMRCRDANGNWGPVFKTVIDINAPGNTFAVYTNPGAAKKCKGTSVVLRAYGAATYSWFPPTGLNTTSGDSVVASPSITTTYGVIGDNGSGITDTAYVTVTVADSATITNQTPLVFCQGDSVVLISAIPAGNYWSTGATTASITVNQTATITLLTDNECGITQKSVQVVNQTPVLTTTQQNITCNGGSNGSLSVNVASDTIAAPVTPGLLISEIFTDPSGADSPFEWVELISTDYLNFAQTPYTVIVSNNGPGSTKGWVKGGVNSVTSNSTYAFQISTGTAAPGDALYVGGSSMTPTGTKARVINTSTSAGDGGIGGGSSSVTTGVLGNGGIADGIAVFKGTASSLDSNSIPTDAVFFGNSLSSVSLSDTSKGFTLPNNDRYAGGHLKTSSYLAPNLATIGGFLRATGTYNRTTGVYSTPRTWAIVTSFTDAASSVSIASNILYSWSNGSPAKSISNLTAGNYTVTVTSAIGCTTTQSYSITQPSAITTAFSVQNSTCFGGSNGAVDASVTGGVPPYSFQWSNGAINASQSGLTAGTYTLTVTDASGCTSVSSVTIGQPPAIVISSFNPSIGNSGTSITIKGSGFTGVNAVIFDTTACLNFTVSGDTQVVVIVPQFASTGPIKLVNSSGCFGVSSTNFQYVAAFANIQVKFIIEGFYLGSGIMNPVLGNAGIGNFLDVDTVTVFLAQGTNPANIIQSQQSILDAFGNAVFDFPGTLIGQSLYIGIRHRNTIETWSKQPVLLQQQTVYDFTQ